MASHHRHHASGVLPDPVISNPASNGWLLTCTLRPDLTVEGVQAWLERLTEAVRALEGDGSKQASVVVGFGPSFFAGGRFGMTLSPAGFRTPPSLGALGDPAGQGDVQIYAMTPTESAIADFQRALSATRPDLASVVVERGYQRPDRRELSGFHDGLRNVATDQRHGTIFTETDIAPEEPHWADGGTYLVYLKISQNLEAMAALPLEEQERIIGRRKSDGSRLDLPEGSDPRKESDVTSDALPVDSHVRKSGPRGERHDEIQIFRRGVPYLNLRTDGTVDAGLQFVSFQASLAQFDVIFNRWMLNPAFPTAGAQADALFARGLVTVQKGGIYFVPPNDGRAIGTVMFEAPPKPTKPRKGRLVIRKRATDQAGNPIPAELGGIGFQLFDPASNQPIGDPFTTNPAGHAMSDDIGVGDTVILREVATPTGFQPLADQTITVTERRQLVELINVAVGPTNGYGG